MADDFNEDFFNAIFPAETVQKEFREELFNILQHNPELPTFPTTLARLQDLLNHPDTGFDEIAEVVKMDPGLTARIFKVVHSAAFAGTEINSVEDALFNLGLHETRRIILASKFMTRFAHLRVQVDWNKFWLHSLLTARLNQQITELFRPPTDNDYLSGLMHDCGKIILSHYFPSQFEQTLKESRQYGCPMFQAEQRIIGTDHAMLGMALCYKWGLHEDIQRAICFHHDPNRDDEKPFLAHSLCMADTIVNMAAPNIDEGRFKPPLPENLDDLAIWKKMLIFQPRKPLRINVVNECQKAEESLQAMSEG